MFASDPQEPLFQADSLSEFLIFLFLNQPGLEVSCILLYKRLRHHSKKHRFTSSSLKSVFWKGIISRSGFIRTLIKQAETH